MNIRIIKNNIFNAFTSFRKVSFLLVISQLASIISIFFLYGIYGSYSAKMQELDINSYFIHTYYEKGNVGELKACLPDILKEINHKLDYMFISGVSEEMMIPMYTQYKDGKYLMAESLKGRKEVQEGRTLTDEDAINESKVVYSMTADGVAVGEFVTIAGIEYEIVGIDKRLLRGVEMPFSSCPDNLEFFMLTFNFKKLPTQNEYNLIKDILSRAFTEGFSIDEFQIKDKEEIISYRTIILIAISIGVVSALNTCLLYRYIIEQRRKQMAVYGVVGATKGQRLIINEVEIMLVSGITTVIGFIIFKFGLENVFDTIYENSVKLFSATAYFAMLGIYMGCVFIFITLLLHVINRDNLVDMLRRARND